MIPEIGEFALIIDLFLSVVLALVPMYGASTANEMWMTYAKPLAAGQFLFVFISFICKIQLLNSMFKKLTLNFNFTTYLISQLINYCY